MTAVAAGKRLVLAGGGHAHLQVLADWIANGPPPCETMLVSSGATTLYSGMLPGWIAGNYRLDDLTIALAPLATRAGVTFREGTLTNASMADRTVTLADGETIAFEWLSIATGGSDLSHLLGDNPSTLCPVRPIDRFARMWRPISGPGQLAVIGGGPAGVELAFALRASNLQAAVLIVIGDAGLLPGFASSVRCRVRRALTKYDIELHPGNATIADGELRLANGTVRRPAILVAAMGAGPPPWLRGSGLALDTTGFVKVDAFQRSTSHPLVFAVGDAATRIDIDLPRSGAHAVHAGPILAHNLRTAVEARTDFRIYHPRGRTLYLLSKGDKRAILTWGNLAAEGRWVWRLKDWIDRRWTTRFRKLGRGE